VFLRKGYVGWKQGALDLPKADPPSDNSKKLVLRTGKSVILCPINKNPATFQTNGKVAGLNNLFF
jgi:hypothetical protein